MNSQVLVGRELLRAVLLILEAEEEKYAEEILEAHCLRKVIAAAPIPDAGGGVEVVVPGLADLHKELQTLRWMGSDDGWDRAIDAVSDRITTMLAASPAPGDSK